MRWLDWLITTKRPTLIVGSAPSASDMATADLSRFSTVAVNNAWRVRADFAYSIYPDDFPPDRRPPANHPAARIELEQYLPAMNAAGGVVLCGATMAFAAGYWAAHTLPGDVIGYYASDMVYSAGATHFYGAGTPDPLRQDVSLQILEAKAVRLFVWALERGKLLVNCSTAPESRLVFPRAALRDLHRIRLRPKSWSAVIERGRDIRKLEAHVPFDPIKLDYWNVVTPADAEFLLEIDRSWLELAPEIREVRL